MMLVNALVWWFVVINLVGFFLFRRWFKKEARPAGLTLADLGLSYRADRFSLDGIEFAKTILLAVVLFAFVYLAEYILETLFIVDYRFLFPFASDLTPHRWLMFLLYLPFFLIGFVLLGVFLHGRVRLPFRSTRLRTFWAWSAVNTLVLVVPSAPLVSGRYCFAAYPGENGPRLVKRYRQVGRTVILESENPQHEPIVLSPDDQRLEDLRIYRVTRIIREV